MAEEKKTPQEVYAKLRDKSISFHDISQGKGVVSDRIVKFRRTAKVAQALLNKVLIEVDEDEALAYINKNTVGKKAAAPKKKHVVDEEIADQEEGETDTETEEDEDETPAPAKKAAAKKSAPAKKAAAKKSLTEDDDD